jgi:amino acid permease
MARSGGLISIITIAAFAILTKLSFDLVILLCVETEGARGSYEHLGSMTFGNTGRIAVVISKFLYSFGCLVAYVKIVKDNFSSAMRDLTNVEWNQDLVTLSLSCVIMLPLCLVRDITLLERVSIVKLMVVVSILSIIIYLYVANPDGAIRHVGESTYTKWFEIRSGYIESLGTFVFTFVAQHTVNLAYESLRPQHRTVESWKHVSTYSVFLSASLSLAVGIMVYVTFWEHTSSAIFELYPSLKAVAVAKLLLCFMMMFTYPLPFFSARNVIIQLIPWSNDDELPTQREDQPTKSWWLSDGRSKQFVPSLHVVVTVFLWGITTLLAILAPSLADVLDLVGCTTGTVIAFILPALFSFKLRGYSHLAAFILFVGGAVGLVGTYLSLQNMIHDTIM